MYLRILIVKNCITAHFFAPKFVLLIVKHVFKVSIELLVSEFVFTVRTFTAFTLPAHYARSTRYYFAFTAFHTLN